MNSRPKVESGGVVVDRDALSKLSEREHEVLSYASWGFMDKQICASMAISPNTLRTYWTRIRSKVGSYPRSALAVAFVENLQSSPALVNSSGYDWEYDLDTGLVHKLTDKPSLYGVKPGDSILFEDVMRVVHPDDAGRVRSIFQLLVKGEVSSLTYAYRIVTERGVEIASSEAEPVRDARGRVTGIRGKRLRSPDLREPSEQTVQIGHWEKDLATGAFTGDEGFRRIFEIDLGQTDLRAAALSRFPPEEVLNSTTFIQRTIDAGLSENRSTHRLQFEHGRRIWATTHLRIVSEGGTPTKALGTVITFQ